MPYIPDPLIAFSIRSGSGPYTKYAPTTTISVHLSLWDLSGDKIGVSQQTLLMVIDDGKHHVEM